MNQMSGWWDSDLSPHLELATPTGEVLDVIVDSGFNGELMLPNTTIQKLGWQQRGTIQNTLADGSILQTQTFMGEILWFGVAMRIVMQATDYHEGLLGTELFQGCIVELDLDADRVTFRKKPIKKQKP
jgi:clan AA aspartic protease